MCYAMILVNRGNVKANDRRTPLAVAQAIPVVRRRMTEESSCACRTTGASVNPGGGGQGNAGRTSARRGVVAGSQAGFRMASGNVRSPDVSTRR